MAQHLELLQAATSGPEKVIGDSFRKHPENMFTTPYQGIDLLCTGKFAYVAVKSKFSDLFTDYICIWKLNK